ncbi:MAG: efflux RND transporter periplasmic adaptor subunit, partial [Proteobacteria bacterium]|nr:efflux RND transporter periplasmic adaptor subunit [Pseudomonadota bacterium]
MNKLLKISLISIYIMIATVPNFVYAGPEHDKHNEPSEEHQHEHEEDNEPSEEHQHEHEEDNDNHDDEKDNDHDGHDDHGEEESGVSLSQQQQVLAEIQVEALQARNHEYSIYAPAEIQANGYTSFLVSPRVDSVVLKRHKALGDHVQKGDKLVTLFSESVAEAQVSLKVSKAEWARVKQLGRQTVGASRYIKAENDFELSQARLLAFGLSKAAIKNRSTTLGEYTLIAQTSGAILSDDFQQGQRVEAGHALMLLSDESQLWVEARIQASVQINLPVGTLAQVKVGDS